MSLYINCLLVNVVVSVHDKILFPQDGLEQSGNPSSRFAHFNSQFLRLLRKRLINSKREINQRQNVCLYGIQRGAYDKTHGHRHEQRLVSALERLLTLFQLWVYRLRFCSLQVVIAVIMRSANRLPRSDCVPKLFLRHNT
jgi:hypothetical protein